MNSNKTNEANYSVAPWIRGAFRENVTPAQYQAKLECVAHARVCICFQTLRELLLTLFCKQTLKMCLCKKISRQEIPRSVFGIDWPLRGGLMEEAVKQRGAWGRGDWRRRDFPATRNIARNWVCGQRVCVCVCVFDPIRTKKENKRRRRCGGEFLSPSSLSSFYLFYILKKEIQFTCHSPHVDPYWLLN
jgi:hypothetical protein